MQARAPSDPRALLDELRLPALFDEIQNVPELLPYIRTRIDRDPRKMGQWLFTGSQEAPLMQGVTESMAGRAAIMQLLPFSLTETHRVSLLHGGYPEALARPAGRRLWFSSYIQTYLERDVRAVTNVRDLATFRRFLALLASRHGQILNKTDLAAPLGVSVPTVGDWLHVLEITGQVILVPPYFENFGKRLIKSPKVYLGDSGLRSFTTFAISRGSRSTSYFPVAGVVCGWWSAKHPRPSIRPWPARWRLCADPWAIARQSGRAWSISRRQPPRPLARWRQPSRRSMCGHLWMT